MQKKASASSKRMFSGIQAKLARTHRVPKVKAKDGVNQQQRGQLCPIFAIMVLRGINSK